jgi:hypothetical protein
VAGVQSCMHCWKYPECGSAERYVCGDFSADGLREEREKPDSEDTPTAGVPPRDATAGIASRRIWGEPAGRKTPGQGVSLDRTYPSAR